MCVRVCSRRSVNPPPAPPPLPPPPPPPSPPPASKPGLLGRSIATEHGGCAGAASQRRRQHPGPIASPRRRSRERRGHTPSPPRLAPRTRRHTQVQTTVEAETRWSDGPRPQFLIGCVDGDPAPAREGPRSLRVTEESGDAACTRCWDVAARTCFRLPPAPPLRCPGPSILPGLVHAVSFSSSAATCQPVRTTKDTVRILP